MYIILKPQKPTLCGFLFNRKQKRLMSACIYN